NERRLADAGGAVNESDDRSSGGRHLAQEAQFRIAPRQSRASSLAYQVGDGRCAHGATFSSITHPLIMTSSIPSIYMRQFQWRLRLAKTVRAAEMALDNERKEIMSELSKTALLFRFPFPGPWGKELTEASHELARDIANEDGLVWKIWLEERETGHAG